MILTTRDAYGEDLAYLRDIDLKCFQPCWSREEWEFACELYTVRLACYYDTPVAFAAHGICDDNKLQYLVPKLAVKRDFRGHGIGHRLLREAELYAKDLGCTSLWTSLPERLWSPGDEDVSGWLKKMGFRATKLNHDEYTYLGATEDGLEFTKCLDGH
jgi:GNAT superfamily N-acetyltransferase